MFYKKTETMNLKSIHVRNSVIFLLISLEKESAFAKRYASLDIVMMMNKSGHVPTLHVLGIINDHERS